MVHNVPITPLRSVRTRPTSIVKCTGSQEQIINFIPTKLSKSLLGEYLHTTQIFQIKWQNVNRVLSRIEAERIVRRLRSLSIPGAEDKLVRLGLFKQLLDGFKSLLIILDTFCSRMTPSYANRTRLLSSRGGFVGLTRPDEAPVAITILALDILILK